MRVKGKVVIVTGGAGGIGAASARLLALEGAKVVLTDVSERAGQALAAEIKGEYFNHDVSVLSDWERITEEVISRYGCIDVLVNCAGIEGSFKEKGLATTIQDWHKVMAVNLDGSFFACMSVMPKMLEKGIGSIILLSSITAYMATPSALAYGVSKAGVQQLGRSFSMIGAKKGARVRCNTVHPGVIETRMTDEILEKLGAGAGISDAEAEALMISVVPFKRRGSPLDVASMVLFLASDESSYVTGSDFKVDGGWLVRNAG